ncbi:MAG: PQQ-dependent sugar dehydrogenase [Pseudomonadales bacterium]|nr:PQQ-dependent sugar dehydrogenase [Pseudomonadales bacterium]
MIIKSPQPFIRGLQLGLLLASLCGMHNLNAQQSVPFQGGVPLAPTGLADQPLGDGPFLYSTAEGMDIRVVVLTKAIEYPTSLAFLPDDKILVTTRPGLIRLLDKGILQPQAIDGGPDTRFSGKSGDPGAVHGYIDIALHPDFQQNRFVYLSYTKVLDADTRVLAVGRATWTGTALADFNDIWVADADVNSSGRIIFDANDKLYITTSGRGDPQSLNTLAGKVLRLNDDGSIPADNPFVGRADARHEIYTYGHRSALGLAVHPRTGQVWQNENGPNGGDEINILKPGLNYGWPLVSLGRTYQGPWQAGRPTHENFEAPIIYWMPAIALSGMTLYTGTALPKWTGDVFVGGLRTGEIPGTGHIERILLNENLEELRREALLVDLRQRIRDIRQGPDGLIYLVTDEKAGAVLRIEPAK